MAKMRSREGDGDGANPAAPPRVSNRTSERIEDARRPEAVDAEREQAAQAVHVSRPIPGKKLYQDEIYGTKEWSSLAVALIDTPEFQRLGQIYQLGFTHTVFRGANHRRFDHCIGAYFMVRTILRRVVQNHARLYNSSKPEKFCQPGLWLSPRLYMNASATPTQRQKLYSPMARWRGLVEVVSAAALLHDLGHVPVGHTMEDEFNLFRKHDSLGGQRLFEMLYGPRDPKSTTDTAEASPGVENFFTAIDTDKLPRPEPWQRVPLPWVLEGETYDRFLPDAIEEGTVKVQALKNHEIRDLIYLILSFKETVDGETGHVKYKTFEQELGEAKREANHELKKQEREGSQEDAKWARATVSRLSFIDKLYEYYSRPIYIGPDHERLPLFHPFMSDAVGNTICADLWDYLVRDGKRLKLDVRDNIRLQRYLVICPASSSAAAAQPRRLAINAVHRNGLKRRDTVSDLMDLMGERYRFAEVAYYHPKKAAFSAMIAKVIEILSKSNKDVRGLDKGSIYPAPWVITDGLPKEPRHVCHFGDESLLAFLAKEADKEKSKPAAEMVRGIVSRSEYRLIFTLDYEAASAAGGPRKFIDDLRATNDSGRKRMEQALEALVSRSDLKQEVPILLYCPNIRMQAKEVAAHVELTPDKVVPLSLEGEDQQIGEEIRVLNGKYQRLWRLYIFAHPKLVFPEDQSMKRLSLLSAIVDAFSSHFGVPESARERGSRYRFISFEERINTQLREWLPNPGVRFQFGKKLEERIKEVAFDPRFWKGFLPPEAPLPVTDAEYRAGFNRALLICAADDVPSPRREKWPDHLRSVKGSGWYIPSAVPVVEEARKSGFGRFGTIAASMESRDSATASAEDWEAFVGIVTKEAGLAGESVEVRPPKQSKTTSDRGFEVVTIIKGYLKGGVNEETLAKAQISYNSRPRLAEEQYEDFKAQLRGSIQFSMNLSSQNPQNRENKKWSLEEILELIDNATKAALASAVHAEPSLFGEIKR